MLYKFIYYDSIIMQEGNTAENFIRSSSFEEEILYESSVIHVVQLKHLAVAVLNIKDDSDAVVPYGNRTGSYGDVEIHALRLQDIRRVEDGLV